MKLNHIKLFENFNNNLSIEVLTDLFLDLKDKYILTEIPKDPFAWLEERQINRITKDNFTINSFYIDYEDDSDDEYIRLCIIILLPTDYKPKSNYTPIYRDEAERILKNEYPDFKNDISKYIKSVESYVESIGYLYALGNYNSTNYIRCYDFGVLQYKFQFNFLNFLKDSQEKTEEFLKRKTLTKQTSDRLRKLGYNI